MSTFVAQIKTPGFWISLMGILGAVGAGLTDSGNPTLIAVGAALTGIYTIAEHIKDGMKAMADAQVAQAQAVANAGGNVATGLPPFYQSDAQHPVYSAPAASPAPVAQTPADPVAALAQQLTQQLQQPPK